MLFLISVYILLGYWIATDVERENPPMNKAQAAGFWIVVLIYPLLILSGVIQGIYSLFKGKAG
jgi:hypothetical protein